MDYHLHPLTKLSGAWTAATSLWAVGAVQAQAPWWPPLAAAVVGAVATITVALINASARIARAEQQRDEALRQLRDYRDRVERD